MLVGQALLKQSWSISMLSTLLLSQIQNSTNIDYYEENLYQQKKKKQNKTKNTKQNITDIKNH